MGPELVLPLLAALLTGGLWLRERGRRQETEQLHREALDRRASYRKAAEYLEEGLILLDSSERVAFANAAAAGLLDLQRPPEEADRPTLADWAGLELAADLRYGNPEDLHRRVLEVQTAAGPRSFELTTGPAPNRRSFLILRDLRGAAAVDQKRRDFVANASHELQTPLAAMIGLLDLLDGADEESARTLLERAQRNAQSMAALTRDLLGLARAEDPDWRPTPRAVKTEQLAERIVERFSDKAEAKGLELAVQPGPPDLGLVADAESLETVVANLVDNALSYTEAGRVELRFQPSEGGGVLIEVADSGPGIPQEILPRIFERFFRGDPARSRASGGTGLGLSIVRNLVGRLGGRISVRNRPGEGVTFRVEMPPSPARPLAGAGQASFN
jgi:signal transduction histidine kinase